MYSKCDSIDELPFTVITPRENDIINDEVLRSTKNDFNEEEIKTYLNTFIANATSAKRLGYEDTDSMLRRIRLIPYLDEIIKQPIMLMITTHVLPYLEAFYKSTHQDNLSVEIVKKDLLHIFTNLLIKDMAHVIRLKNNGLLHIGRISIPEAIFKYSCTIARLMNSSAELLEIKEEELVETTDVKLTPFKKFFYNKYNPLIFRNEEDFHLLSLSRENCIFLQKTGQPEQQHYSFIHPIFLDYFATLLPQSINGRRKKIELFMNDFHVGEDLSPQADQPIKFI